LLSRKGNQGNVLLIVQVDDCYVVRQKKDLEDVVHKVEAECLKVKVEKNTSDYLSCEIVFNHNQTKAWLGQPHLIKKLIKTYGYLVGNQYKYKKPGTPKLGITKPKEESEMVSKEERETYRSAFGSLLHLVNYSRPDITNIVRELSKCASGPSPVAFKEMKRVMKFVLDTKD
jgi:hypothetical protein